MLPMRGRPRPQEHCSIGSFHTAKSPTRYRINGTAKLFNSVITTSPTSPGATCFPSFTTSIIADYDYAINQFQVVQPDFGKLVFNIVKADLYDPQIMENVIEETRRHLGQSMDISVEFVDQVALGRTGKRQHSLSKIDVGAILGKIQ